MSAEPEFTDGEYLEAEERLKAFAREAWRHHPANPANKPVRPQNKNLRPNPGNLPNVKLEEGETSKGVKIRGKEEVVEWFAALDWRERQELVERLYHAR